MFLAGTTGTVLSGMADNSVSIDYWRKFFRSANSDIFQVIEKAILVAASDRPDEFSSRRDRIAETLFTCRLDRCSGCDPVDLRAPHGLEEDDGSKRGGEEDKVNSSCHDPISSNEPEGMNRMVSSCSYDEADILTGEIEEESQLVGEVLRIKEVITNQDESEKVLFECLRRLQLLELSVETLKATEIGKTVNSLRRHNSKQIRQLVRTLVEGWKLIVDEWMKATAAIADTPPESFNPSVMTEEDELAFPPVDEGELLASQTATIELSKIFDGIDEDGNPRTNWEFEKKNERKPQVEYGNPAMKQRVLCPEEKGQMKKQEAVTRQLKPQESISRPPKPQGAPNRQTNPATDLAPPRLIKIVLKPKPSADTKSQVRQDQAVAPKKPSTTVQDVSNKSDGVSLKEKLDNAKRKLHEGYQQAENAKKQRRIQVMEMRDIPKLAQNQRQPNPVSRIHVRCSLNGRR